jgi:hypothetical protein
MTGPWRYIEVWSITNPSHPTRVQEFLAGNSIPKHLVAHGDYLYFGSHTSGLGIADISDPPNAFNLFYENLWANIHSMTARGDSLYLGGPGLVKIVDITNRTAPVDVGDVAATGNVEGVTLHGQYLYMTSPYHGLDIVDLEQPGTPVIGHFPGWLFRHVTIHDGIAYVSSERAGVYVLDVTDPTQPQMLGVKRGGSMMTMVRGDHLIVSGSGYMRGIEVLPLQCKGASAVDDEPPAAPHLELAAYPNPFNPQTNFSFSLREAGTVEMTIHDLNGRLVRRLLSGRVYSAGNHTISWNGRDDQDRPLASGKYLGRLQADGLQATLPVVLLK